MFAARSMARVRSISVLFIFLRVRSWSSRRLFLALTVLLCSRPNCTHAVLAHVLSAKYGRRAVDTWLRMRASALRSCLRSSGWPAGTESPSRSSHRANPLYARKIVHPRRPLPVIARSEHPNFWSVVLAHDCRADRSSYDSRLTQSMAQYYCQRRKQSEPIT
jgi:hypothetical protein